MAGLPYETEEDLDGIYDLAARISNIKAEAVISTLIFTDKFTIKINFRINCRTFKMKKVTLALVYFKVKAFSVAAYELIYLFVEVI